MFRRCALHSGQVVRDVPLHRRTVIPCLFRISLADGIQHLVSLDALTASGLGFGRKSGHALVKFEGR